MGVLPTIRKLYREDLVDAPSWIDKLIQPLNMFLDSNYNLLNKGLTFGDNVKGQIKTFSLTAKATADLNTLTFACTISGPSGLIPVKCVLQAAVYTVITNAVTIPSWRYENGTIKIDSITGLTSGSTYVITVLVI